jgi:hypothetical protein
MLDFPASGQALWALSDRGGPRPEYLLPVLYYESGFNPAVQNAAGAPYYGIGQNGAGLIAQFGADPQTYLTWPASQQLSTVVTAYFLSYAGQLNSGTRTYQAEYLPGTLKTARSLGDIIASSNDDPHGYYAANKTFDWDHKGSITVGDMAHAVASMAAKPAVQQAIAQTYALRPSESPRDPVYGTDFGAFGRLSTTDALLLAVAAASAVAAVAVAINRGHVPHPIVALRRALA